jgi:hypothetical protein
MTDDQETAIKAARAMYRYNARARQIIDMCVVRGLRDRGEGNPYGNDFDRHAADVATEAVALLLQYIYEDDGEISRLKTECDLLRKMVEDAALRFLPPITVKTGEPQPPNPRP